ncbi:MAG: MBL fold metallo-hydrolase [Bacteroidota bacterium]|nr:MBL fold metallo-hydrolase [Bacteroidota bacterium]MDX5505048.1 MBL fold metallo-hydrolase [Bacteroidota bacterium]
MFITFLGTGTSQGVPVIGCNCSVCQSSDKRDRRMRTSAMIQTQKTRILIDCGPDFRQQMLSFGFDDVDGVLITHEHQDHVAGIDDLRAINFQKHKPVTIYCTERVENRLRKQFNYAFAEKKYPGAPVLQFSRIRPNEPFWIKDVLIEPFEVDHGGWPVLGFTVGGLCYITDAKTIPENALDHVKRSEVLVLNALRKEEHYSHLNLLEALEYAALAPKARTFLTHISHHLGSHAEVSPTLPEGVNIAHDGQRVRIG